MNKCSHKTVTRRFGDKGEFYVCLNCGQRVERQMSGRPWGSPSGLPSNPNAPQLKPNYPG